MKRVRFRDGAIEAALGLLPARIVERVQHVDFFQGEDPNFAGLHSYKESDHGHSYRDVAHYVHNYHQMHMPVSQRRPTVVIPWHPWDADHLYIHELGHALHDATGLEHVAEPCTAYGATNHYEAFAEALVTWAYPGYRDFRSYLDPATRALLEELAGGEIAIAARV